MAPGCSFEEFSDWFDDHERRLLTPAMKAVRKALDEYLDANLNERDRARLRVSMGRVKSKTRTWRKLEHERYDGRVSVAADIPEVIDDLVGIRIICTNRSDVLRAADLIEALERCDHDSHPVLALEDGSIRDYISDPKPSGYRAYHANLCTSVPIATDRHRVRCELQIRTLLQDSWGELTHEDTYKPDSDIPELVRTLSKRIADLTSGIDELAQDLRDELDRLADVAVLEVPDTVLRSVGEADLTSRADAESAYAFLAQRVERLSSPIDLASMAWELQKEFGPDIAHGWLGHDTFKSLLLAAVPTVTISSRPPAFIFPPGFVAEALPSAVTDTGGRGPLSMIRNIDRSFPDLEPRQWRAVYSSLAIASADEPFEGPVMRFINNLTRRARDTDDAVEERVARAHLQYVAKALLFSGELRENMTSSEIADVFSRWTLGRLADLVQLNEEQKQEFLDAIGIR